GVTPRDTRVDRMLRLALRLLPQNNEFDEKKSELLALMAGIFRCNGGCGLDWNIGTPAPVTIFSRMPVNLGLLSSAYLGRATLFR
ncbi:hypothetical protein N9M96_00955, partial [Euryarchaeota archaeon]|nr:hypothetical protein [Euryarchaeota archaeon]